jgi:hypothetical protein
MWHRSGQPEVAQAGTDPTHIHRWVRNGHCKLWAEVEGVRGIVGPRFNGKSVIVAVASFSGARKSDLIGFEQELGIHLFASPS